jgi:predicted MFS family arabinose efflux permease
MTLYLTKSLGFTLGQAGFIMALFGAGAICGGFIGGKLTDKFGFYFIQLGALVGGGIMFLILGQMTSYPLICLITFCLSLINESFRPANAAAIAHYSSEDNRTRSYSLNRLSINLGWAFGGALGGFIASYDYHLLFIIDGLTNITAALLLWGLLAPSKNKATGHKPVIDISLPARSPYRDKPYLVFIALSCMFAYTFFQLFSTMPVFWNRELHLSEFYIGSVMALNGILIALFEMVLVHKMEGKRHNLLYIFWGVLLTGVSFVIFNVLPSVGIVAILSTLIITIGEILSMPFMNSFWISRSTPATRGQYAGLYTISWSTAQVLGPATGTQIADRFGFTALWWIIGLMSLACALGFKWLQWRLAKKNATESATTE